MGELNKVHPGARDHAKSRYLCVTESLIDVLQQAYLQGRDLGLAAPYLDVDTAAVIVAETLEADHLWNTDPVLIVRNDFDPGILTDFKRAVLAEILFSFSDLLVESEDDEQAGEWWALAMATLQDAAESPTASPLLWYKDLYVDLGTAMGSSRERGALGWFKRALAHNLRYDEGSNAIALLLDLAETYLRVGEPDAGLCLFAELLRHDPTEIWIHNTMAHALPTIGLANVAVEAVQRGLQLLDQHGDPDDLRDELTERLDEIGTGERQGHETEVTPTVLAELREALAPDFDAGQSRPLDELCHALVPDLDQIPVKRPMTPDDIPLPDRPEYLQPLQPPARKPGRNDPCWCGSGIKYKRCHMRSDRADR